MAYKDLADTSFAHKSSAQMRSEVLRARAMQGKRYGDTGIMFNSRLTPALINRHCRLDVSCNRLMKQAFETLALSARAYTRIVKVARTIADIGESESIRPEHIAEALSYRGLEKLYRR